MEGQPQPSNMVNGQPSEQVFSSSVATNPDIPNETGHCSANEEMGMPQVVHTRACWPTSPVSEESVLDWDISLSSGRDNKKPRESSPPLLALAPGTQLTENSAAYFLWPPVCRPHGSAEERAAHFKGLQKDANFKLIETTPTGQQATTLLDLMVIRAYNSRLLRRVSLGTAVGFRTKKGILTDIPAIIVFVARKVQKAWLSETQRLPVHLEGPGGIWCDVDVVEFCYYGAPAAFTSREHVYTELAEDLRGNHPCIGPGSQVASQETIGTLGAIVQSRTGARQVGFLTNRHVAVDLNYPSQKMFHPLPPNVGPGIYLGAVERATSFITDEGWYNIFASTNPETFVRVDGAFVPFSESLNLSRVTTAVKGVGEMGDVIAIDLQAPIRSIVGKEVMKVGRSSGLTKGNIMAYALEYNDEKGICFFTDFLIVGENKQAFDLEGDSGSLILMTDDWRKKPRPVGIIWGGTANRGRLKMGNGCGPENWTSGVDLGHLLEWLQLDLITGDTALEDAIEEQRRLRMGGSIVGDSSPARPASVNNAMTAEESHQWEVDKQSHVNGAKEAVLDFEELHTTQEGVSVDSIREIDFGIQHVDRSVEHAPWPHDSSDLKKLSDEDRSFSLHLNEREAKRRRH